MGSFTGEVQTTGDPKWYGNACYFKTEQEARDWVTDLSFRWSAVEEIRVVESEEEPNR